MHGRQPRKPPNEKHEELSRLYAYYVSRVREVFEEHRRDHRRLFGQDYLCWAQPEREDLLPSSQAVSHGRRRRRNTSHMDGTGDDDEVVAQGNVSTMIIKEGRENDGVNCEAQEGLSGEGESAADSESRLT